MDPYWQGEDVTLYHGDCVTTMAALPAESVDAIVTDPPYGLEFMGKDWDAPWKASSVGRGARVATERAAEMTAAGKGHTTAAGPYLAARVDSVRVAGAPFQAWCLQWATEALRVLKPGGHLLAFGGTRTWHRLAVAIEDAGFEIRDSIAWLYGGGFPKSRNASRDLDGIRCACEPVPYSHAGDLRGMRPDVQPTTKPYSAGEESDLFASVQRGSAGSSVGDVRRGGAEDAGTVRSPVRGGQPGVEGRCDVQAAEGQLHRPEVRSVSGRSVGDGAGGWVRDGASASDGAVDRSPVAASRGRESQGPESTEQPAGQPGALPVERGSQARGGRAVCERCGKPVVPDGLGTALKPAFEPIVFARKPLVGTVAGNVQAHGTGALNIDAARIGTSGGGGNGLGSHFDKLGNTDPGVTHGTNNVGSVGRWPANVVLDADQAATLNQQSGVMTGGAFPGRQGSEPGSANGTMRYGWSGDMGPARKMDAGGAARFFYVAKAPTAERPKQGGIAHPTVKPIDLMQWLIRLVTPPGGTVLDPFAGSGTTGEATIREGFTSILIEREADYLPLIRERFQRPINYLLDFDQ